VQGGPTGELLELRHFQRAGSSRRADDHRDLQQKRSPRAALPPECSVVGDQRENVLGRQLEAHPSIVAEVDDE